MAATIAALGVSALLFDALSFRQSAFLLFLVIGCAGAHWSLVRNLPKRHRNGVQASPEPASASWPTE
jgi:hypothetical protein